MPILRFVSPGPDGRPRAEVAISPVGVTIGRDPRNHLVLDDPLAEPFHARILPTPGGWLLEDAGSGNGTWVGANRVTAHCLRAGEVVTIGRTQVAFVETGAVSMAAASPPCVCPGCGRPMDPTARFCGACGRQVPALPFPGQPAIPAQAGSPAMLSPTSPSAARPGPTMPSSGAWPSGTADPVRGAADRRGRLPALLALVGVILCAGAVVGVVVLRRDRPRGPGEPPPASGPIAPSPEVGASSPVTSVDGGAVAGEAELAPEILAFGAQTSELAAGATTRLQVRVADGTAGQVWWRASCGAVARNPDAPTGAIFVAPAEPGLCTVTVEVENPTRTTRTTASQDIAILAAFAMEAADDVATP